MTPLLLFPDIWCESYSRTFQLSINFRHEINPFDPRVSACRECGGLIACLKTFYNDEMQSNGLDFRNYKKSQKQAKKCKLQSLLKDMLRCAAGLRPPALARACFLAGSMNGFRLRAHRAYPNRTVVTRSAHHRRGFASPADPVRRADAIGRCAMKLEGCVVQPGPTWQRPRRRPLRKCVLRRSDQSSSFSISSA